MMWYAGREVPVGATINVAGDWPREVPELGVFDRGEKVGDWALVEGDAVEWDGQRWVPSQWRNV